jgi:phospholipase C
MIICFITLMQTRLKNFLTHIIVIGFALATTSASASDDFQDRRPLRNLRDIKHIIIIYQENWSFDALYGQFPGADGYANSFDTLPQFDVKTDPPYSALIYQTPSPLTGFPLAPDPQFPSVDGKLALGSNPELALPLIPYDLTKYIKPDAFTGDIVHRFYHQQLQIDNGLLEPKLEPKNGGLGKFVTWSDNPGLVLSYFERDKSPGRQAGSELCVVRQLLPFNVRWLLLKPPLACRCGESSLDRADSGWLAVELRLAEQSLEGQPADF